MSTEHTFGYCANCAEQINTSEDHRAHLREGDEETTYCDWHCLYGRLAERNYAETLSRTGRAR